METSYWIRSIVLGAVVLGARGAARAQDGVVTLPGPPPPSYALVVGSNRGGDGQEDLLFAHEDARRVASVLTEVGGYEAPRTVVVLDPDREGLLAALARIRESVSAHAERGEPSVFLFYYSGHARARALSLGVDELPLPELRERLADMPATVTLAILDACQSGAISMTVTSISRRRSRRRATARPCCW